MELNKLSNILSSDRREKDADEYQLNLPGDIKIYSDSIRQNKNNGFFIGKQGSNKYLYVICNNDSEEPDLHGGNIIKEENSYALKQYPMTTENRKIIQQLFEFTNPVVSGLQNSFGFGDRIGLANHGQLQSLNGYRFFPILAQQSIRELTRTNRTAYEVMDASVWAVLQEGFTEGFGADADHLKTTDDIDLMVKAGYKMFTFDPGEFVENKADSYSSDDLLTTLAAYPWKELDDNIDEARKRYLTKPLVIDDLKIEASDAELLKAYTKYGRSLAHVKMLHDYMKNNYSDYVYEIEVSVDETDSVTSVFEHYFISSELHRLKINYVSLAPRFVGSFEKGIDYKGDLSLFEREFKKHILITEFFGDYKISLHSGSDKFSVYKIIGKLKRGFIHVKTAGTSYLEALRVVAMKEPELLREILDFSRGIYEDEKRTYHVSADINKVKNSSEYSDEELITLFSIEDSRQVLHVTFGKVLTEKDSQGKYLFKEKIIDCLNTYEETHNEVLVKHFKKHLEPFK